jgi:hypothetical protein
MKKTAILLVAVFAVHARAAAPSAPYFNGFEKNTAGWFDSSSSGDGTITRRPSGYSNGIGGYANGIASADGKWHARLTGGPPCDQIQSGTCYGPYTNWGGYSSTFPAGGYLTQVDIYLDVNWAATHTDYRFDWISAINNNAGGFLRDFVFNVGEMPDGFHIQTSTNSTRSGANPFFPCPSPNTPPNTCRPPVVISTSGWYTFRHTFRDNAGNLAVDFDIFLHGSSTPVLHQTIYADPMSTVGGNRYGWFSTEEIPDLPIDNSLRTGLCHDADGDGETDGEHGGKGKGHFKFHKHSCEGGDNDNVSEDDDDSNTHFQSTSITSATFTQDEDSQTVTIIGTGLDNGVPVGFTMVAIDNGDLVPAVYGLALTDGYILVGNLTSGSIAIK